MEQKEREAQEKKAKKELDKQKKVSLTSDTELLQTADLCAASIFEAIS